MNTRELFLSACLVAVVAASSLMVIQKISGRPGPAWPSADTNRHPSVTILTNIGYVVGYCEDCRDPVWVSYRLTRNARASAGPRPSKFRTDRRTQAKVSTRAYEDQPYDRGHMAPNSSIGRVYGEEAQKETFFMSNVAPQNPDLNRGMWKMLEAEELDRLVRDHGDIRVLCGPVIDRDPPRMGAVAVPRAFYKVIVGDGWTNAFLVEQDPPPGTMWDYQTNVVDIEAAVGVDLFPGK